MRASRNFRILAAAAVVASLAVPGSSRAGKPCVSWDTVTPVVSNANGVCSLVSDPFTTRITSDHCFGLPPAGVTSCITLVVYVP